MNDKKLFTVRDVVWFITLIIGILSTFFVMQGKVSSLETEVFEIKETLHNNNLELLNYKVEQVNTKIDEFTKNFNDFVDSYDSR